MQGVDLHERRCRPPNSQAAMPTQLPVRNLDLLRAVAVTCVIGDHVTQLFSNHVGPVLTVSELGRVGVLMFFVHTALVLMASLERQDQGTRWIQVFYARRAFRIYPLAIVAILGYLAFHVPSSVRSLAQPTTFQPISTLALLQNVALVHNLFGTPLPINVLWSLPLEVQMYVALPLCFLLARRRPAYVVALMVGGASAWWIGHTLQPVGVWRLTILNYVPCFLAGVLAYAVARHGKIRLALPAWCWPLILLGTLVLAGRAHPGDGNPPLNWLVCVVLGLAIPLVRDGAANWFARGTRIVCEYSYGIYLTHVAALWFAFVVCHDVPLAGRLGIFVAVAALLAFVSYHAIEQPGIAAGKHVAKWLVRDRAETVAPVPD